MLNLIFLLIIFIGVSVKAVTPLDCIREILKDQDFDNNPHHPDNFIFAKLPGQENQFILTNEKINLICTTMKGPLVPNTVIEIQSMILEMKEPRKLFYFLSSTKPEKPQKLNDQTVPTEHGFLPAHITMASAVDGSLASPKNKNSATCEITPDSNMKNAALINVAKAEILDLYADFGEQRDSLSYNYDIKADAKAVRRKEFDLKLKKLLNLCAAVPELKSVSDHVIRKIQPKSSVIHQELTGTKVPGIKNDKLPGGTKQ